MKFVELMAVRGRESCGWATCIDEWVGMIHCLHIIRPTAPVEWVYLLIMLSEGRVRMVCRRGFQCSERLFVDLERILAVRSFLAVLHWYCRGMCSCIMISNYLLVSIKPLSDYTRSSKVTKEENRWQKNSSPYVSLKWQLENYELCIVIINSIFIFLSLVWLETTHLSMYIWCRISLVQFRTIHMSCDISISV